MSEPIILRNPFATKNY